MKMMSMKYISMISATVAVLLSSSFVSCTEEPVSLPSPVFPEKVVETVAPGTEHLLTFRPDRDWTVRISDDAAKWFWILDGTYHECSISGCASEQPVTVKIVAASLHSLESVDCEVVLSLGEESRVIAVYTLETIEPYFNIYAAKTDENGFVWNEELEQYDYDRTAGLTSVSLVWNEEENRFMCPVLVESNVEWDVEWPRWARADFPEMWTSDKMPFEIYGLSTQLPLDATSDKIVFSYGDESHAIDVTIPGCRDMFSFMLGGYNEVTYNHAGDFVSEGLMTSGQSVEGTIYGPADVKVVVAELADGTYRIAEDPWINLEVADYEENTSVLQTRKVSFDVPEYFGTEERSAVIFFLSAAFTGSYESLFSDDMTTIKDEYLGNVIKVLQQARPEEYFTFEYPEFTMEAAGVYFSPDAQISIEGLDAPYMYELRYTKEISQDRATLAVTEPYKSYSVYDAEGNIVNVTAGDPHWLSFNLLNGDTYGVIDMNRSYMEDGTEEIDGYISFEDVDGNIMALVHCCFESEQKTEKDVLEDASDLFVYPDKAAAAGATLHKIISGPTYELYKEDSAPLYLLTYTEDDTSHPIRVGAAATSYSCKNKTVTGPEMVTVDGQMFYDYEWYESYERYWAYEQYRKYLIAVEQGKDVEPVPEAPYAEEPDWNSDRSTNGILSFGKTSFEDREYKGISEIHMKMPEGTTENEMSEVLTFKSESSMMSVTLLNIKCVLNLKK